MPLVHADTSDRASIRIQKRPGGFVFRNPGTLRVPAAHALQGGESDCRNRTLHQLFLQLGLGERAGSGLPKIRAAWEPMGYSVHLHDTFEPYDQSILEMVHRTTQKTTQKTTRDTTQKTQETPKNTADLILLALRSEPGLSRGELAARLGDITADGIKYHLGRLQEAGRLRRIGPDKGGHWEVIS